MRCYAAARSFAGFRGSGEKRAGSLPAISDTNRKDPAVIPGGTSFRLGGRVQGQHQAGECGIARVQIEHLGLLEEQPQPALDVLEP